jgi:hypothetical protein
MRPPAHTRLQHHTTLQQHTHSEPTLQHVQAAVTFKYQANHIYNSQEKKETIDTLLNANDSKKWTQILSNEFGRLAQGNDSGTTGTNTIDFLRRSDVPPDKKISYGNFICNYRPLKTETNRVHLTAGGDKIPYNDDAGSPAASLLETKLLLNSTIPDADKGSRFMCADLKDHFLALPMKDPEFMQIKYNYFPEDIC